MTREIDILCFSGTGNTAFIVDKIVTVLNQHEVILHRHSVKEPYTHIKGHELLLAFPINSQATSPYIWKYIQALPDGNQDKVHVVITLNQSASILKPLKKLLLKKGYVPFSSAEISMPTNLVMGKDQTLDRIEPASQKAEQYADVILNSCGMWKETMKGSAFTSFLSRNTNLPWGTMRLVNKLTVNPLECSRCGLCATECPVTNIEMHEMPIHKNKCEFCFHCAAVCPKSAIHIKGRPSASVRNAEKNLTALKNA